MARRAAVVMLLTVATPVQAGDLACPAVGDAAVALAAVDARLELRLVDGRRLRLVGVDPAGSTPNDPDLGETSRAALAGLLAGHRLRATMQSDKPDRWGRVPALIFIEGDVGPGGVTRLALAKGLGRYQPEPGAHGCREVLLAAEGGARGGALGLWRDPYYGVLAADDREAFAERAATTVVVEARLRRVDAGPFRTKLRLAAPGTIGKDLLVGVVTPKVVKRFGESGVRFEALIGRTVRFRGLLDLRFGPQVELAGPDAFEILDDPIRAGGTP